MTQDRMHNLTELLSREFLARLDGIDIVSRKIFQGKMQGERRSKRRGQSVEFADHRPYAVGDDLRHIDWNIYARLDQLFLRLFMEEQDLTVHLVLDVSESVSLGEPSKAQALRQLAAALGYVALVNNSRLIVSAFSDGVVGQTQALRGRGQVSRLADFLMDTPPGGTSQFDKACRQLQAGQIGSGVVIVLSDFMFKEGFDGLARICGKRYELYAIQVLSPQELEPPMTGDLKLVDVEDGDVAEVTVSAGLLKFYKRTLAAYCNDLKEYCTRRGGQHVLANSSQSMEQLVMSYLRKRGLLR